MSIIRSIKICRKLSKFPLYICIIFCNVASKMHLASFIKWFVKLNIQNSETLHPRAGINENIILIIFIFTVRY